MIDLAYRRWCRAQEKVTTIPPKAWGSLLGLLTCAVTRAKASNTP